MASLSEKIVSGIAATAAIAAVIVATAALRDTARQLAGKTAYDLAKDGKALQRRYKEGTADVDEVTSYFFSAYRLHATKVLDDEDWTVIDASLCAFTNGDKDFWSSWDQSKKYYPAAFQELVQKKRGQKCA